MDNLTSYTATFSSRNPLLKQKCPEAVEKDAIFSVIKRFDASSRKEAVFKAKMWMFARFNGALGKLHEVLALSDPRKEVRYHDRFNCSTWENRYLDEETIARVLAEANGELVRDTRTLAGNRAPCSVIRIKRRRNFTMTEAPGIERKKDPTRKGWLYCYRLIVKPQISKNGVVIQRHKVKQVPLEARTLEEAVLEVERRGLYAQHKKTVRVWKKERSLKFVKHVTGIAPIVEPDDKKYFADSIARHELKTPPAA